ncbi:hypothetical protein NM208_g15056 [Fusarium decemcellulare]|uniref:Uncharacterized protein n=1 Tax=Fusarium decemcellulare TaxID=57161 RepID=A0ACC1RE95_9HYPO|nr:hypothetical protein NM208_g15056 [Fusarium decemcellulare]
MCLAREEFPGKASSEIVDVAQGRRGQVLREESANSAARLTEKQDSLLMKLGLAKPTEHSNETSTRCDHGEARQCSGNTSLRRMLLQTSPHFESASSWGAKESGLIPLPSNKPTFLKRTAFTCKHTLKRHRTNWVVPSAPGFPKLPTRALNSADDWRWHLISGLSLVPGANERPEMQ